MKLSAEEVIHKLGLSPLPFEGGFFRRTFESEGFATANRRFSTAIYYLVTPESFSALHRVKSDEMFHFYQGDAVEMIQIDGAGELRRFELGTDLFGGQVPQVIVPHDVWQGLRLLPGGAWALLGTTVSPGFEYEDFELGDRALLLKEFPRHEKRIREFTRG